jgi:hypothetical protein
MDSDSKNEQNKQESIGDKFFNDSDILESFRVRYISLQINAINKRLLITIVLYIPYLYHHLFHLK